MPYRVMRELRISHNEEEKSVHSSCWYWFTPVGPNKEKAPLPIFQGIGVVPMSHHTHHSWFFLKEIQWGLHKNAVKHQVLLVTAY